MAKRLDDICCLKSNNNQFQFALEMIAILSTLAYLGTLLSGFWLIWLLGMCVQGCCSCQILLQTV